MATREENLKKINDELEELSDKDLERVAGGTWGETADDSRFLNVLLQGTNYHHCDRYGATRIAFDTNAVKDVMAAWKSLGVSLEANRSRDNEYYMDGQKVSRYTAWNHAQELVGRHLTTKDWDW